MVTRRVQEATETNTYITAIAQIVSKENPTAQNFPEHVSLSFILKQTGYWFLFMSAGLTSSVPSFRKKKKEKNLTPRQRANPKRLVLALDVTPRRSPMPTLKKKKKNGLSRWRTSLESVLERWRWPRSRRTDPCRCGRPAPPRWGTAPALASGRARTGPAGWRGCRLGLRSYGARRIGDWCRRSDPPRGGLGRPVAGCFRPSLPPEREIRVSGKEEKKYKNLYNRCGVNYVVGSFQE